MYSIGVDIGGSHITACVYNHATHKLQQETLVHNKVDPHSSRDEIIKNWVRTLAACRDKLDAEIRGVGIAMPGPFDYYNGISLIRELGKLQALYRVNIREELAGKLRIAPHQIRFINDATAFSIAEAIVGRASSYHRTVAITLGTGFGSSFVVGGKPVIQDKDVPQGGFLYNQYYGNRLADDVFSTRGIIDRYQTLSGKEASNVKALCERIPEDYHAQQTFETFGASLGEFLKPYLSGFSAEVLVLGGNIAKAFPYFGAALTQQLAGTEVYISEFGEEAAMIGGALLVEDTYYSSIGPTIRLMNT